MLQAYVSVQYSKGSLQKYLKLVPNSVDNILLVQHWLVWNEL